MVQNKALVYKKVPTELPVPGEHIAVQAWPVDTDAQLEDGSVLVKLYSSVDPYMRGRLRQPGTKSYASAFDLEQPLTTQSVVKVLKSARSNFKQGQLLVSNTPIADYAVLSKQISEDQGGPAKELENPRGIDLPHFLGALGLPGLTAYASFYEIGRPKKGETIFVTAASGAVGQLVCQIALHDGLVVVASVGDDAKAEFLKRDVGVKHVFNYKKDDTLEALKRFAPNGLDIFYDNVGGKTLEDAIENMNEFGRIVVCGAISQYNLKPEERYGVSTIGGPYAKEHHENAYEWIADGKIKPLLAVTEGIDNSGEALLSLFKGTNFGKAVIKY